MKFRDGKKKGDVVDYFVSELRKYFSDKILGVYIFGSTAKGIETLESDIDILVVYSNIDEHSLLEVASEISFKIACEGGNLIETTTMSKEEFEKSLGHSPFLWEVLKFGRPVFTTLSGTEWELDFKEYIDLAEEYLGYSIDALKENKLRLSIDSGYNACELLAKALIINTENPLASSHGGIVGQFGRLFVLTGKVQEHLGRNLNLGLDLRAKARYKPRTQLEVRDAEFIIKLSRELLNIAKKEFLEKRDE